MNKKCYICGRDLCKEPAIRKEKGFTCFPCCYRIDKEWDEKYAPKMKKIDRVRSILKSTGFLAGLVGFVVIISGTVKFDNLLYLSLGLCGGCFLIAYGLKCGSKHICPNPPWNSVNPMYRCPEIVLEEKTESMTIIEMIKHRYRWRHKGGMCDDSMQKYLSKHYGHILRNDDRYPENWKDIRKDVLSRDENKCRLCNKEDNLHVHHVKPISKGGNHTPQNLITLCKVCHESQAYFMHKALIEIARCYK
ncbi:MAG: HNH endonuclease [Sedimentisphaerales bacterium]|jgi:hypothetical protein